MKWFLSITSISWELFFHPLLLLLSLEGKEPSGSVCILSQFKIKSEHHIHIFFFLNTSRCLLTSLSLATFLSPSPITVSTSSSPSPRESLFNAGHKCIHRSFNSQLNQEANLAPCYLPCWDPEKLLKGRRDANWIHFPCDRVGCSLRTQHQQRLPGFLPLPLWLATVLIGTTLPALTGVSAVEAAEAAASPLGLLPLGGWGELRSSQELAADTSSGSSPPAPSSETPPLLR